MLISSDLGKTGKNKTSHSLNEASHTLLSGDQLFSDFGKTCYAWYNVTSMTMSTHPQMYYITQTPLSKEQLIQWVSLHFEGDITSIRC